jgi:cobalt/nickel transport system permease protein
MISGAVCPVTLAAGTAALGFAIRQSFKKKPEQKDNFKFILTTLLIFALQMLNYPVGGGVSGHFVGGALAVLMLGYAPGLVSMGVVLCVQALVFGDGGILAFGANFISMGIVPGTVVYYFLKIFKKTEGSGLKYPLYGLTAYISVVDASIVCGLFIIPVSGEPVLTAKIMAAVHSKIAVGEAFITAFLIWRLKESELSVRKNNHKYEGVFYIFAAVFISPFASSFPDGLEYSAGHILNITTGFESIISGIIPDYSVNFINSSYFSVFAAAVLGIAVTFFVSYPFQRRKL